MLHSITLVRQSMLIGVTLICTFTSHGYSQATSSGVDARELTNSARTTDAAPYVVPRTSAEIQRALRVAEQAMGSAETDAEKTTGIITLCLQFVEIGQHEELPSNASLQRMSVRLRARLQGVEARTVDELRRRRIPEPEEMVAETQAFRRSRGAAAKFGSPQLGAGDRALDGNSSDSNSENSNDATSGIMGSASNRHGAGSAAPGGLPDYGWTLVNLIRQTVRPDYWATAGGPGKAIYFGHSRALVIHGSWRVQEEVADLLNALRGG